MHSKIKVFKLVHHNQQQGKMEGKNMETDRPKKIGGFDRYEVEGAARTLIEAQEIKAKPKFLAVVIKEVERQALAAERAAMEQRTTAKLLKLKKDGL